MGTYLRLGEYKINPIKIFRKYAVKKNMGTYNIWHYYDTKAEFETAKEYYKKDKQVQFFVFEKDKYNLIYKNNKQIN
jgi:hypothetical protein